MRTLSSKLAFTSAAVMIVLVVVIGFFVSRETERFLLTDLTDDLDHQVAQVQRMLRLEASRNVPLEAAAASADSVLGRPEGRLTLIDSSGAVVYDTRVPAESLRYLSNHLDRPEIVDALARSEGSSERLSASIRYPMLYHARAVSPLITLRNSRGETSVRFIRASLPLRNVQAIVTRTRRLIIGGIALLVLIVSIAAFLVARRITSPLVEMARAAEAIRNGDLSRRIDFRSQDEFGRLADALNGMVDRLTVDISTLRKLERVRSEFLGNVSHELRTPIFAIQGMLETLLGGAIDDAAVNRDFLTRALEHTRRLDLLLGDLIDISRIESGEMKLRFRFFAVDEFLASTVADFQRTADQKHLALVLAPLSEQGIEIYGDRERLRQVLANLIDNGIKYTDEGGTVSVTATMVPEGVAIAVRDTGIGIAVEHQARIFERFYRVDKDRSREAGGTGLGLAIVKHILEAHGSAITVTSAPGKGSTFSFTVQR